MDSIPVKHVPIDIPKDLIYAPGFESYKDKKVTTEAEALAIIKQYAKAAYRFHESGSHVYAEGNLMRIGLYVKGEFGVADNFWEAMRYLALRT